MMTEKRPGGSRTPKRTEELEKQLSGSSIQLVAFLKENQEEFVSQQPAELLKEWMRERKITKSQLAQQAKMSDVYLFQILNGRRHPSRDRLLSLCIALKCALEEVQEILKICRYTALYVKDRRDAIIMYGILRQWSVAKIDDALFDEGEETLV